MGRVASPAGSPQKAVVVELFGLEDTGQGRFRCVLCNVGPFDVKSAQVHAQGKSHQKRCADPRASTLGDEEIENLPEYVDVNVLKEGEMVCLLCNAKANLLSAMQKHLDSERHARACRRAGYPEIAFVPERRRLEVRETGRPVSRKEDETFVPEPLPAKKRSSRRMDRARSEGPQFKCSDGDDFVQRPLERVGAHEGAPDGGAWSRWSGSSERPMPETAGEAFQPQEDSSAGEVPPAHMEVAAGEACRSEASSHVRDGAQPGVRGPCRRSCGPSVRGGAGSARARHVEDHRGVARARICRAPQPGQYVRAMVDVAGPPNGWSAANFLIPLSVGDEIRVACVDGDSFWGIMGNRAGWVMASVVDSGATPPMDCSDAANEELDTCDLPPGWKKVWNTESQSFYYADLEGMRAQWEPPAPHTFGAQLRWVREVDVENRAIWRRVDQSEDFGYYFFEADHEASGWIRRQDWEGRVYWANHALDLRFFER
mmetsp:Transcript_24652/g.68748  ORF Transcript_24652/g.68748 Transcript_24652/m.68748 type:complete len:485 (+) Transcript_24652:63-1517(+)